jgi:hypothetical protein
MKLESPTPTKTNNTVQSRKSTMMSLSSEFRTAVRLITFKDFIQLGSFPRYPDKKHLTVSLEELSIEQYNSSLIVFISHCWLRGWSGAEGWDGIPHPDNFEGGKYRLCVEGIQKIFYYLAPGMRDCYIWLDYGCIDQDGDPATEVKLRLDKIIQVCDCIFTPIFDEKHESWKLPEITFNWFADYKSQAWNGGQFSYLNRGWCRIEMFYAANVPLFSDNEERTRKMDAGLKIHRENGTRPHIIYGSRESAKESSCVIFLPPLQKDYFKMYHPEQGHLTKSSDKTTIRQLIENLQSYMKTESYCLGYTGEMKAGFMHGRGILRCTNGFYEGEWKDGLKHGKGIVRYNTGDSYEGDWKYDQQNGFGIYRFAQGTVYEGEYRNDRMNGYGISRDAGGPCYEGQFRNGLKNGRGTTIANGNVYEGEYLNNKRHGTGLRHFANGDIYEGEWKTSNMDGQGLYRYSNGDVYKGEYRNGKMDGYGIFRSANGTVVDGIWEVGVLIITNTIEVALFKKTKRQQHKKKR